MIKMSLEMNQNKKKGDMYISNSTSYIVPTIKLSMRNITTFKGRFQDRSYTKGSINDTS